MAKGYVQQQGVDFKDVFAPVARADRIRAPLACIGCPGGVASASHGRQVGILERRPTRGSHVRAATTPGCVVDGKEDMVLRLDKALYELRLAPRCLRPRTRELPAARRRLRRRPAIAKFKKQMCAKFQMSDLGLLFFFIWALRCSKGATASNSSRRHTQARSWSVRAWRAVIRASLPWSTA